MKKISFLVALILLLSSCTAKNESFAPEKEQTPPQEQNEQAAIESEAPEEMQTEQTQPFEEPQGTEESQEDEEPHEAKETDDTQPDEVLETEELQESAELVLPEVIYDERDYIPVMQVGGVDISYATFSYYLNKVRNAYPGNARDALCESALYEIKCDVATELLAQIHSTEMTEEYRKEYVDGVILNTIKTYNGIDSVSYAEALEIFNMTDLVFRHLQENSVLCTLIYNEKFSPQSGAEHATDEKLLSHIHNNYIRIKHILISTADLDDDGKMQAKRKAEEALARARNGENFEELISTYSDDSMDPYVGYYFTYGDTVAVIEEKGFEMAQGTISDLVESPYGYHIIKKYPLDDQYILSDTKIRQNAENELCEKAFYEALFGISDYLGVVRYDNYDAAVQEILGN